MNGKLRWINGCVLGATLVCPSWVAAGGKKTSKCGVDNCAAIPCGAIPQPAGTYINEFIRVQETKAEMDDFVLYQHMWFKAGTELGPLGRYQLDMIAKRLPTVRFPVVIETSKIEALDDARRKVILTALASRGYKDPTRVIVAYPQAEGLYGDEAPLIYNGIIRVGSYGNIGGFGSLGGFGQFGLGGLGGGGFGGFGGSAGFGGFGGVGGFRGF